MNKNTIILVLLTLVVGVGGGYWLATKTAPSSTSMGSPEQAKKPLFYRNPMNPAITSAVPAQDDMGMDYIPVYADGSSGDGPIGTVKIDPVTIQNIGVRFAVAQKRVLSRSIRAVGRVAFNEEHLSRLHPKIEGWIEQLYVDKTGEPVKKGTILLSIYSPQLVSSQEEYLLALKNRQVLADSPFEDIRQGAVDLVKTARERLQLLDVAEHQIKELEQTRTIKKGLHIHSPFKGIVMKVGVREGQHVTPKTLLYLLADLSEVWVYVNVYEYELPWIGLRDKVDMRLNAVPGRVFKGRVDYIYPYAEAKTRTIKVRLKFDNPNLLLKPDMFADITIHAARSIDAIVVPSEAVVRSGTREQVFVVRAPGKFEPREVKIGITDSGLTQILEGLKVGEEVLTSAQFLIDSESKLREATAKMLEASTARGKPAVPVQPAAPVQPADPVHAAATGDGEVMDMQDMDMGAMSMEPLAPGHPVQPAPPVGAAQMQEMRHD